MRTRTLASYIRTPGCYHCVVSTICTEWWCKNIHKRRLSKKVVADIVESGNTTEKEIRECLVYLVRKRKYMDIIAFLLDRLATKEYRNSVLSVIAASCNKDILQTILEKNNLDIQDLRTLLGYLVYYSTYPFLEYVLDTIKVNLKEIDPENNLLRKAIEMESAKKVRILLQSMKKSGVPVTRDIVKLLLKKHKHFPISISTMCHEILESDIKLDCSQKLRDSLLAVVSKHQSQ